MKNIPYTLILLAVVLTSLTISPQAFAQKNKALWVDYDSAGSPQLILDRQYIKDHPKHFRVVTIKGSQLTAGQMLAINDQELEDLNVNVKGQIFNVIKAGTFDHPVYQLINGHNRIRRALLTNSNLKIEARILEDFTNFSEFEQAELLSVYGHFWGPENSKGHYKKLRVTETVLSPWRTMAKIPWVVENFKDFMIERLAFPEIEFGKKLFEFLIDQGHQIEKLQTTRQVLEALESEVGVKSNCYDLLL